jgi:copper chaperone CopZ
MFKLIRATTLALLIACVAGCVTPAGSPGGSSGATVTYEVFGMGCPGCHGGVEKNLAKIEGVAMASANWQQQKVTIYLEEGQSVDPDKIEAAIRNSNFTVGKRLE